MSLEDKQELLAVIKASESTALEEENDRVGVKSSWSHPNAFDEKIENSLKKPETTSDRNDDVSLFPSPEPSSIVECVPDDSDSNSDSDKLESPPKSPKIPKLSLRLEAKPSINNKSEANSQSNMITSDSKSFQSLNVPDDGGKYDVCNMDNSFRLKNSPLKALSKEDRKRNIDVFNCEEYPVEHPLVYKQPKVSGKPAFYYVPHGMNLQDFTAYFKQQLNTMAQQLVATQQKSLNLVPWGEDPIVVITEKDDTVDQMYGQDPDEKLSVSPVPQNQRYNFRGRSNKRKCSNDIFDFSSEESSNDEHVSSKQNIKRRSRSSVNPYAGIAKRKSIFTSLDNHLEQSDSLVNAGQISSNTSSTAENNHASSDTESLTNDQDNEENSQNIEKFGLLDKLANEKDPHGMDESDEESNNYGNKIMRSASKMAYASKIKKGKRQLTHRVSPSVGSVETPTSGVWLNTLSFKEEQEEIIIKPGPVNLRKKTRHAKNKLSLNKTQQVQDILQEVDDQLVIDESEDKVQEICLIACPICKEEFNSTQIELHAAECSEDSLPVTSETSVCPICQNSFSSGSIFNDHAKHCKVTRRLVPPPLLVVRSRNKR